VRILWSSFFSLQQINYCCKITNGVASGIKVVGFDVTGGKAISLAATLSTGAMLETLPMDSSERIEILLTACKKSSYLDCVRK
jgi:hypothetical protein